MFDIMVFSDNVRKAGQSVLVGVPFLWHPKKHHCRMTTALFCGRTDDVAWSDNLAVSAQGFRRGANRVRKVSRSV